MANVVITSAAEADYFAAFLWYLECGSLAAERFEKEFEASLNAIAEHPTRYAYCDQKHRRS